MLGDPPNTISDSVFILFGGSIISIIVEPTKKLLKTVIGSAVPKTVSGYTQLVACVWLPSV
tara:strand:- start:143 stop:325 length:183 start_codon:yes stop_codon:yes gene_type:complete